MNRVILVAFVAIFLSPIGCNDENRCEDKNGYETNCVPPEYRDEVQEHPNNPTYESQSGTDSLTYSNSQQSLSADPEPESLEEDQ